MKSVIREYAVTLIVALAAILMFHAFMPDAYYENARFDEGWYLTIATKGYEAPESFTEGSSLPFSPGFPGLWRLAGSVTGMKLLEVRSGLTALLFIIGVLGLAAALRTFSTDGARNNLTVLLFVSWPGSLFFLTAYAEALYFPLLAWFFVAILRRWYLLAAGLLAAALFTRSPAIILAPTLIASVFACGLERLPEGQPGRFLEALRWSAPRLVLYGLIGSAGLFGYTAILSGAVGEPFAFLDAYAAWVGVRESASYAWLMQTPVLAWLSCPAWHGVQLSIWFFLLAPFLMIPWRRWLPPECLVFVAAGWLFFLHHQSNLDPFVDMLRWTAVLFPVHYCVVLTVEKFTVFYGKEAPLLRFGLCGGLAVLYGAFYVRCVIRFANEEWVS